MVTEHDYSLRGKCRELATQLAAARPELTLVRGPLLLSGMGEAAFVHEEDKRVARFYTKRPVAVEAVQYTGENPYAIAHFISRTPEVNEDDRSLTIHTLEGDMKASVGDWIIKGVKGEFYPCKPDIFAEMYQPTETPHD